MSEQVNPGGPPQPASNVGDVIAGLGTAAIGVVALGVTFVLVSGVPTRTEGATRSAQLQWETRQQQIEQVVAKQDGVETQSDVVPSAP